VKHDPKPCRESALRWDPYPAGTWDEDEQNFLEEKEDNMSEECRTTESCVTAHKSDSEGECNFHEKLLALADDAWMELLKDKIKAEIEKSSGQHMDNIAKLVADANCARWGNMIQAKVKCNEFKESLKALMIGGCTK
jgi:hypothetical protein